MWHQRSEIQAPPERGGIRQTLEDIAFRAVFVATRTTVRRYDGITKFKEDLLAVFGWTLASNDCVEFSGIVADNLGARTSRAECRRTRRSTCHRHSQSRALSQVGVIGSKPRRTPSRLRTLVAGYLFPDGRPAYTPRCVTATFCLTVLQGSGENCAGWVGRRRFVVFGERLQTFGVQVGKTQSHLSGFPLFQFDCRPLKIFRQTLRRHTPHSVHSFAIYARKLRMKKIRSAWSSWQSKLLISITASAAQTQVTAMHRTC